MDNLQIKNKFTIKRKAGLPNNNPHIIHMLQYLQKYLPKQQKQLEPTKSIALGIRG